MPLKPQTWENHFGCKEEDCIVLFLGEKKKPFLWWDVTSEEGSTGSRRVQSPLFIHRSTASSTPSIFGVPGWVSVYPLFLSSAEAASSFSGTARGCLSMWKPAPNNNLFHQRAQAAIWHWQCWVTADLVFSVSWYQLEPCQFAPVESLSLNGGDYPDFYSGAEKVAAAALHILDICYASVFWCYL